MRHSLHLKLVALSRTSHLPCPPVVAANGLNPSFYSGPAEGRMRINLEATGGWFRCCGIAARQPPKMLRI